MSIVIDTLNFEIPFNLMFNYKESIFMLGFDIILYHLLYYYFENVIIMLNVLRFYQVNMELKRILAIVYIGLQILS